ncbi:NAD(P)H-binding protein [Microbacterium kribbense]|uniref:NAD(P)H-binding protein n=1 Tax=Microbacterium kribbense TaxID=433645 RepID=A0ABP7G7X0_9MICO
MRVFLAGASGVIGTHLLPLLKFAGHDVAGMTRTEAHAARLEELGAVPVVCDVYDLAAVTDAMVSFEPDLVLHELTDLPDDPAQLDEFRQRHARIRIEGTRNLIRAARAAGARRFLAQSVAWPMAPGLGRDAVDSLERSVLEIGGVVLRYGQFYGPDTFHTQAQPTPPRVRVDRAAEATVAALREPTGILVITDDGTTRLDAPAGGKED